MTGATPSESQRRTAPPLQASSTDSFEALSAELVHPTNPSLVKLVSVASHLMAFHYQDSSRAVFDLASASVRVKGGGDDVLVLRDGAFKVERRSRQIPELLDGKYWACTEVRETREPSADDLVTFRIESVEDVVQQLQRAFEVGAPGLIREAASREERLTPTDLGPADGIELSLEQLGAALRFSIRSSSPAEVALLQRKIEIVNQLLSPQIVEHCVQLLGGSSAVRFKLNMAVGELLPNALGHNLLGLRLAEIPKSPKAIEGDLLEKLLECPPGDVVLRAYITPPSSEAPRELVISVDQPCTFRFTPLKDPGTPVDEATIAGPFTGAKAFESWWATAEEITETTFLENTSGRGAIILRDLLKLQGAYDSATNRMTFRVPVEEWLS